MHVFTLLAFIIRLTLPAPDTTFWDGGWHRVARANAVYYGWTTPLDSGRCRIQDFYISGERQMEAFGWAGPPVLKDGPVTYYYRSGAKKTTGRFANGKHAGEWQYWNEDGTLNHKKNWTVNYVRLTQEPDADSRIPMLVEQMPVFPDKGGVVQYLASTLHRPAGAPLPAGGGKVYVQFVVGPQGNVTSARVVKGFDPAYDAEVLRAVVALPRWRPGKLNGEPTAVRFIVPVTFR